MNVAALLDRWDRLRRTGRWLWGSALGLLSIAAMSMLTLAADALLDVHTSEVMFLLPVMVAAFFGLGPGLLTTVVAAVVVDFFFLDPPGAWPPATDDDALILLSFTSLALMESALVAALSRARWRYQRLVHAAPTPILRSDARGRIAASHRLEALVEGILDMQSIQAGSFQVQREPVALQQIVAEAVAIMGDVWEPNAELDRSILRVNVYRLRRRLDAAGDGWGHIHGSADGRWGLFHPGST